MNDEQESTDDIARRMDAQRSQLQRQFAPKPAPAEAAATPEPPAEAAPPPYEPRSLTMRLLRGNPQLVQRALLLAVATLVGARYSSWVLRLGGMLLAHRTRLSLARTGT